jgi:hypothetical protein
MTVEPPVPNEPDLDEPDLDETELDRALAAADPQLTAHLRTLLDPDADLTARTATDVDRALRSRDTLGAALELLGLGWWTTRALLTDDTRSADRDPEGS